MWRSKTIRGRMVAITVRSTAPRKTAASAAASGHRPARSSLRSVNLDLRVMVEEIERPDGRLAIALARRFGKPGAEKIERPLVYPEIDGDRRPLQRLVGQRVDDLVGYLSLDVERLVPVDLLVVEALGVRHPVHDWTDTTLVVEEDRWVVLEIGRRRPPFAGDEIGRPPLSVDDDQLDRHRDSPERLDLEIGADAVRPHQNAFRFKEFERVEGINVGVAFHRELEANGLRVRELLAGLGQDVCRRKGIGLIVRACHRGTNEAGEDGERHHQPTQPPYQTEHSHRRHLSWPLDRPCRAFSPGAIPSVSPGPRRPSTLPYAGWPLRGCIRGRRQLLHFARAARSLRCSPPDTVLSSGANSRRLLTHLAGQ